MALIKATCKAIWFQELFSELDIPMNSPTTILINNQSTICFARIKNKVSSKAYGRLIVN